MKKIVFATAILASSVLTLNSCSSGSSGTPLTAGGLAFQSVNSALGGAEGLISGSVGSTSISERGNRSSGLSAKWEVSNSYNNPKYNSSECPTTTEPSMITLKKYMGTQFESNQKRCNGSAINIFGRLDNAAGIVCIMMNKLTGTTSASMSSSADLVFTMDAAEKAFLSAKCPMMAEDLNNETNVPTGTVVTLSFAAPAVTTTYDLKITIMPFNNIVFLKYGSDVINFAKNEDNGNGSNRTIVSYDLTTKVLRAEYISKSKGTQFPMYVHRLYKDETSQQARIMSAIHSGYSSISNATATNKETYTVSGYPSSNEIAFSIDLTSMGPLADGMHEACVDGSNGNITNDAPSVIANTFGCGTVAATGKDISYVTAVSSINATVAGSSATWWNLLTGAEVLNWTDRDNMLTQGL